MNIGPALCVIMTRLHAWAQQRKVQLGLDPGQDNTLARAWTEEIAPYWRDESGAVHRYSWCGEFVSAFLFGCGFPYPKGLNRKAVHGVWQPAGSDALWAKHVPNTHAGRQRYFAGPESYTKVCLGSVIRFSDATGGHWAFIAEVIPGKRLVTWDGNGYGNQFTRTVRDPLALVGPKGTPRTISWCYDLDFEGEFT